MKKKALSVKSDSWSLNNFHVRKLFLKPKVVKLWLSICLFLPTAISRDTKGIQKQNLTQGSRNVRSEGKKMTHFRSHLLLWSDSVFPSQNNIKQSGSALSANTVSVSLCWLRATGLDWKKIHKYFLTDEAKVNTLLTTPCFNANKTCESYTHTRTPISSNTLVLNLSFTPEAKTFRTN